MTEHFPAIAQSHDVKALSSRSDTLVGRGLTAILFKCQVFTVHDQDARYRQVRDAWNRITDDGSKSGIGNIWSSHELLELRSAFETFQLLADAGYGKAYLPLYCLYCGHQSIQGDKGRADYYEQMAFDWCFANQLLNDPEIWNDLGLMYRVGIAVEVNYNMALHWFRQAADAGNAQAMFNLCGMYEDGNGVKQDYGKALHWQIQAAERGNLAAMLGLIRQYEFAGSDIADDEQALYWCRRAAELGYPWTEADFGADRFFELGMRYRYGDSGTQKDNDKALEYFLEAAELDHAEAQYELFELYGENGEDADSEYWLECSANLGYGPAQLAYAEYPFLPEEEAQALIDAALDWHKAQAETGNEVRQFEYAKLLLRDHVKWRGDPEEGLKWLIASAEQDYMPACCYLGNKYLRDGVSEQATQQGIYWLSHAVELGDSWACKKLGDFYLLGHGGGIYVEREGRAPPRLIEPNKKMAIAWYERGIAMGDRSLAYHLGLLYLTGEYIDQDVQLAEKWLLHSAMAGYGSAQEVLGTEYALGTRLRQDTGAAIDWLESAAKSYGNIRNAGLKLAKIYLEDKIVNKNIEKAIKWLTHAADSGTFRNNAMKMVAEKCFDGRFNSSEKAAAQAWLVQMAAITQDSVENRGNRLAPLDAINLAELYELGLGVEQNLNKAIDWYKWSAEHGMSRAKIRLHELGINWETH